MKHTVRHSKSLVLAALFVPFWAISQSSDQNYIKTKVYKKPFSASVASPSPAEAAINVSYYDGLGRPIQQVGHKQSNTGNDVITTIRYDKYGRQSHDYLPYPAGDGTMAFRDSTTVNNGLASYPTYAGQLPYSRKRFENSPLSRVLKQSAPGNDWAMDSGHEIKFDYQVNGTNEVVSYSATVTWDSGLAVYKPALSSNGYYAQGKLYKSVTKDENWVSGPDHTIEEFKDFDGRVILKRTYEASLPHDTYYVYDQFGNLTYVLPPKVSGTPSQGALNGLCCQYRYDHRNRLAQKKLPGKQWEYILYDKLDRVVGTGPAQSPFTSPTGNGWLVNKYDAYDRVILTGWMPATVDSLSYKTTQQTLNSQASNFSETKYATTTNSTVNGVAFRYTNVSWPASASSYHVLTVNYYDDYNFPDAPTSIPTAVMSDASQKVYYNATRKPAGLSTGTYVRIPETSVLYKKEVSYVLYDSLARPVRNYKLNHLGGYTQTDTRLHFSGKPLVSEVRHKYTSAVTPAEIYVKNSYTYSAQDRLINLVHKIGTGASPAPQLLFKNEYDDLGQLVTKRVGGTSLSGATSLQKVDYQYNIRGWLTGINDVDGAETPPSDVMPSSDPYDLFRFRINYQTVENNIGSLISGLYNGNISETAWRTYNDNKKRRYGYRYDALSRLTDAFYQKPSDATPETGSYNETVGYDKNGNITYLERTGEYDDALYSLTIDDLDYVYDTANPNRLVKVSDNSNNTFGYKDGANVAVEFEYDAFGNMTRDRDKGISNITYNHLNLPLKVTFDNTTNYIQFTYNATGGKIGKEWKSGTVVNTAQYLDGFQYTNGLLDFFPTEEGYVEVSDNLGTNVYDYVFHYKDHLGNIRLRYGFNTLTNGVEILEENNFYPFGLQHRNYNITQKLYTHGYPNIQPCVDCPRGYQYKYNGKEWQDELGLNIYDYGARNYDPAIGRFVTYDPLAESTGDPYAYCYNNPVNVIDPTGMSGQDWVKRGKDYVFDASVKSQADAQGKYGADAQHLGEGSMLTGSINGATAYQYTFHNDGTITDAGGNLANAAEGFETAGGSTIHGTNSIFGKGVRDFFASLGDGGSQLDDYRAYRGYSGYHSGESKMDRIFRLMGNSHAEQMLDFGGGGYNMFGGYGRVSNTTSLFRAVSEAELADINAIGGLRTMSNGYETGKLFTNSAENAAQFGKWLSPWDNSPMTIIRAQAPNSVMRSATSFTADGLPAYSIPSNQLGNIRSVGPLNYSPIPLH